MSRRSLAIVVAVLALLMSDQGWSQMYRNTATAGAFELKSVEYYFTDPRAVAVLRAALAGDAARSRDAAATGAPLDEEGPLNNADVHLRLVHYAVASDHGAAVRLLIELGADPELDTAGVGPALLFAITLDKPQMLNAMLDARPFDKLSPSTQTTLMFQAVSANRPRCLDVLLTRGAPIDLRDTAGYTVLMRAIGALDVPLASSLLDRGASLQVEASGGATPANLVQMLLKRAAAGSPLQAALQDLKTVMQSRGLQFPAPTAQELRAARPRP